MSSVQLHSIIGANLARIRDQIAKAAERTGRHPSDVRLVAAVKYATDEQVAALLESGCHDLAESRPQNLWRRVERFPQPNIRWHFIGHLQRNKVRRTLPHVWCLHSADSWRILEAIDEAAAVVDRGAEAGPSKRTQDHPETLPFRPRVLIEVNISGDTNKGGFAPAEMPTLLPRLAELRHMAVVGLMGMASLHGGRETARRDFARLRQLREALVKDCPANVSLHELSMGMSDDFDLAIAEGATMVRLGSALFEGSEDCA